MSKRKNSDWLLIVSVCLLGLALFSTNLSLASAASEINYDLVSKINLGISERDVEKLVGRPSRIVREEYSRETLWEFMRGTSVSDSFRKLVLTFSGGDKKLIGISYLPQSPDRVFTVAGLKNEFPKAVFKTVKPGYCGAHIRGDEFEHDAKNGLRYEIDNDGSVAKLVIYRPVQKRKVASESDACPQQNSKPRRFVLIDETETK